MQIERLNIEDIFLIVPTKHRDPRAYFQSRTVWRLLRPKASEPNLSKTTMFIPPSEVCCEGLHSCRRLRDNLYDVSGDLFLTSPSISVRDLLRMANTLLSSFRRRTGSKSGCRRLRTRLPRWKRTAKNYKVTNYYAPDCERGLAWDDPTLDIDWRFPSTDPILADKDRRNPRLADIEPPFQYR
jgi:dTDP-4-dehydrorhamnose 3,5-epimerase